jgi:phospholipid/cholesterol/gamma-HCH transport system ATP-binding protein
MITIQNVHKSFGPQVVLAGVNLQIRDGQTTAIVGPSGVGKSVLLKLIMGIMKPDAGEIVVEGDNITKASSEAQRNRIRAQLGVLFQSAALFDSLTVYDNIAFALRQRTNMSRKHIHERVVEMIESLSLADYVSKLPQEISIGVRKRVGLARALITEPTIVLFDEPNTGLDPLVGQEVYDLIKQCRARWRFSGVVISHEIPEVFQVSDRVAMLLNGNFVAEGTPDELRRSDNPAVQQFLLGKTDGPIKIQ